MASSSPPSTPPALTPDDTGSASTDSQSHAEAAVKNLKTRRSTAFYPNMNSANKPVKPFSRSAAKRQSVMTLGSIEHLQHYFTKTGIVAKPNPSKKLSNQLVPALGGISAAKSAKVSLGSLMEFELPPSPTIPQIQQPAFPPFVKTYETDPEAFLPGVVQDLMAVADAWGLSSSTNDGPRRDSDLLSPHTSNTPRDRLDILNLLKITTRAIRSVRNYVITLPDDSAGTLRSQYRNKVTASSPHPKRNAPHQKAQADPLSLVRKSALEVLAVLRELEERSRVPLSDEVYDVQSDHGSIPDHSGTSPSRVASPAALSDMSHDHDHDLPIDPDMSISFVHVQGRQESVPVWEDDYYDSIMNEEEGEKRHHWDDRLVLGGGWLYKQDMTLTDLVKEEEVVRRYVDVVDDVLFGEVKEGKRGWEREHERFVKKEKESRLKSRRVSAGDADPFRSSSSPPSSRRVVSTGLLDSMQKLTMMEENEEMTALSEEESVDEDDLPEWAMRGSFAEHPLDRAHALIYTLLPEHLCSLLPPATDRNAFLLALSSGQFLCIAYNTGVRWSRKPWGFISPDSIHDIVALEAAEDEKEKSKTGWTFRRTDNLRLWAAALKIRYLLPMIVPSAPSQTDHQLKPSHSTPANSPSKIRFPSTEPPIIFDPRLVARKDEGWETMLQDTLLRWVEVVVDERRGER
ncbi:uncharacterized protein F5891DRAFT_1165215 [Suillus fuscotomentosus]|uniref:Uncharacterized protein n=1 Tax=Suillus fuscotomentosus TaxID=1912939 RepID=A0AAD4E220_9AGAM|nr:uncharacterized protein F5891DRAFT_1165215 [Suillus fuscotomentosus]KAG1897811.1 hypothetical protein F5891DRAFT_1165215 [Suillus fuscotomentosus]